MGGVCVRELGGQRQIMLYWCLYRAPVGLLLEVTHANAPQSMVTG